MWFWEKKTLKNLHLLCWENSSKKNVLHLQYKIIVVKGKKQNSDFWNDFSLSALFREKNHETEESDDSHLHRHCVKCMLIRNQTVNALLWMKNITKAMPKLPIIAKSMKFEKSWVFCDFLKEKMNRIWNWLYKRKINIKN